MKLRTITIAALATACLCFTSITAGSQPKSDLKPTSTVILYPEGQAAGKGLPETEGPKADNGLRGDEKTESWGGIFNINENARFDLYIPKKPNGQMVVVCPGGGYSFVSSYSEGLYVAEWMLERGIAVAVVKYRLPDGHWEVPLTDVQNTFRYCRAHAGEWGVKQIGVMGFSAGGHLAASATTMYEDSITRPDFSILVYPVISLDWSISHGGTRVSLLGPDKKWNDREGKTFAEWEAGMKQLEGLVERYSLQNNVTPQTPPVFIAHCTDDTAVPVENSLLFYRECVADKVPVEMHIYPHGGHGWGFTSSKSSGENSMDYCRKEFDASLTRWLDSLLPEN